jgi:hypothetical protein
MLGIRTFTGAFCCKLALAGILALLGGCGEIYLKPTAVTGEAVSLYSRRCAGLGAVIRLVFKSVVAANEGGAIRTGSWEVVQGGHRATVHGV